MGKERICPENWVLGALPHIGVCGCAPPKTLRALRTGAPVATVPGQRGSKRISELNRGEIQLRRRVRTDPSNPPTTDKISSASGSFARMLGESSSDDKSVVKRKQKKTKSLVLCWRCHQRPTEAFGIPPSAQCVDEGGRQIVDVILQHVLQEVRYAESCQSI